MRYIAESWQNVEPFAKQGLLLRRAKSRLRAGDAEFGASNALRRANDDRGRVTSAVIPEVIQECSLSATQLLNAGPEQFDRLWVAAAVEILPKQLLEH